MPRSHRSLRPHRLALHGGALVGILVSACSLDSTNPTGSGSGGDASSSGATQPTTGVTTGGFGGMATSSGNAMTTGASMQTTSSDASSSSSSDASSSVSSSSGGVMNYPFCLPVTDDFDGYTSDPEFVTLGETAGPWFEIGKDAMSVVWQKDAAMTGGQIQTKFSGGKPGYLFAKTTTMFPTSCAVTVRLVSVNGGDHLSEFGVNNGNATALQKATIECRANAKACKELFVFGSGPLMNITPPITLALVVKSLHVTPLYNQNGTWTVLPMASATGIDISTWVGLGAFVGFGQETGDDHTEWDDFNVLPVPLSAVP